MKKTIKFAVAAFVLTLAIAACTSKPAETATETTDSLATETPVVADSTATEAPADSTAAAQ